MNLEQMRARLAAIVAQLETLNALEDLSNEEVETVNSLSNEFETLQGKISAKEKMERTSAQAAASTRKTTPAQSGDTTPRVSVEASAKEKMGGFNSAGEFFMAVKKAATGDYDKRFQNSMFEKNGEDGGILVPETMMTEVQKKMNADDSLLAKTSSFTISGNSLTLPTDETTPWSGGIQAYWVNEGLPHTESKHKFGSAGWRLHKLGALVKITDELAEDAVALESYIKARAPEAIVNKLNGAILSGDGVGKPMGLLSSGFRVTVAAESAQAADTIVAKNVAKMYSRMLPASRSKAAWYINAGCEEQLRVMKDDLGNFIYMAPGSQLNQTPYGMLLGRPVIPLLGAMPALGDEGDIVFADLSYYYSIVKAGGIKSAISAHLLFDQDKTAYKFIMRVDGSVPFKTPVTTEFGGYQMSGIVTLAAR